MNTYKGKVSFSKEQCILCQTCAYVCPAGAIDISSMNANESYDFIIWHNTCTLCGNCAYFCPTGAIHLSDEPANAKPQSEKYTSILANKVTYGSCAKCHEPLINVPEKFIEKGFKDITNELRSLFLLCPKCRQHHTFERRVR